MPLISSKTIKNINMYEKKFKDNLKENDAALDDDETEPMLDI